jgi:hypothetical protein
MTYQYIPSDTCRGTMVDKQDYIKRINMITQWTLLVLIIFGGGAVVFILGIILTYMIASGVI